MKLRYLSVIFLFITVSTVIFGIGAFGYFPTGAVPPTIPPTEKVAPVKRSESQGVSGVGPFSKPTQPVATQVTRQPDGLAILESHCIQCHQVRWILQIQKPLTSWEKALEQMEAMGVHLEDTEKDILLDYLAMADKP